MIDTHAHLNDKRLYEDLDQVLENAKEEGVKKIVCIGYDFDSSILASKIANEKNQVFAVVGVHPHDAKSYSSKIEKELESLVLKNKKIVAIGEIGLDFHYDFSPRDLQKTAFEKQLVLAKKLDLPVVNHTREAFEDTIKILKKHKESLKNGGVMHCFVGNAGQAQQCVELGLMLSFGGSLTFDKTGLLLEVLKVVPKDKILLETDAPYMTPVPFRGKVNQPKYLKFVLKKMAEILEVDEDELKTITTQNAERLFGI